MDANWVSRMRYRENAPALRWRFMTPTSHTLSPPVQPAPSSHCTLSPNTSKCAPLDRRHSMPSRTALLSVVNSFLLYSAQRVTARHAFCLQGHGPAPRHRLDLSRLMHRPNKITSVCPPHSKWAPPRSSTCLILPYSLGYSHLKDQCPPVRQGLAQPHQDFLR